MTKRLYSALIDFYMSEFEESEEEAKESIGIDDLEISLECITLQVFDEHGKDTGDRRAYDITLIPADKIIIYEVDGETAGEEVFDTEEEIADYLDHTEYSDFYDKALHFEAAPTN